MRVDILLVPDQRVFELLLQVNAPVAGLRQAIDGVHHQMEPIEFIQRGHVEGRRDRALFLVASNMDVRMVSTAIGADLQNRHVTA